MLKREITKWDLVLLMINTIVGAGIFGLPSKIFGLSGVYSLPALFLCALIVFILVLNFAEVGSRFDKTGGPYLYIYSAFGRIPAFVVGWLMLLTRIAAYAALINLFVTYLSFFNPIFLLPAYRNTLMVVITLILTWLNYRGVKNSTLFNSYFAVAKIIPLFIFIVVGSFYLKPELFDLGQTPPPLTDFSASVLILIFAFTGFEAVLINTGEIRNPRKNIPFALVVSMIFVTVFYAMIQFVSIGTLPGLADSERPITDAAQAFMGPSGGLLITIGALVSIGGAMNAMMLMGSRVPFALSEEDQFPKFFGKLHPKFHTPVNSTLLFAVVTLTVSLTGSFTYAVSITVINKVLVFLMVSAAMIKLRKVHKNETNYFKLPYGFVFAFSGIAASVWLLAGSEIKELYDVLIAIASGIILYIIFGFIKQEKNSRQK
jgi:amino acid transporter